MTYRIEYGKTAAKQFGKIARSDRTLALRIRGAIDALAIDPRPPGCIQLTNYPGVWRIRVGDWRIVYTIEDDVLIVTVVLVEKRGEVYRNLPSLRVVRAADPAVGAKRPQP